MIDLEWGLCVVTVRGYSEISSQVAWDPFMTLPKKVSIGNLLDFPHLSLLYIMCVIVKPPLYIHCDGHMNDPSDEFRIRSDI